MRAGGWVVRDLIYEWATKKRELGLDKVLLVIVGCEVKPVNKMLASKHGIAIWDENDFERFFTKAIEYREVAKDDVLRSIGIEPPMQLTKSSAEQELVEELLQPVAEEALRPAGLGFYEMMKLVALVWIFLGWIFMGFVALLTPLTFSQALSMWLMIMIPLIIAVICLRMWVSKEKEKAIIKALMYLSGGQEEVPSWELAQALNMKQDKIEKTLNALLRKGKVKLTDGRWELA